jgi:hypothetical protein
MRIAVENNAPHEHGKQKFGAFGELLDVEISPPFSRGG